MRKHVTQHAPGTFLMIGQRLAPDADRDEPVQAGCRVTIRQFAAKHGLKPETWRHECYRGATGVAVPNPKDKRRRKYAGHDPLAAQDRINGNNANKGTKMPVTNRMAFLFRKYVTDGKPSPCDAVCIMAKEMPGRRIPYVSTRHRRVNANGIGVPHGSTPHRPDRRNRNVDEKTGRHHKRIPVHAPGTRNCATGGK